MISCISKASPKFVIDMSKLEASLFEHPNTYTGQPLMESLNEGRDVLREIMDKGRAGCHPPMTPSEFCERLSDMLSDSSTVQSAEYGVAVQLYEQAIRHVIPRWLARRVGSELVYRDCDWRDAQVSSLSAFLLYANTAYPEVNIVKLDLSCNHISDQGIRSLARCAGALVSLETLDLSCNSIGGAAGSSAVTAAAEALPNLTHLLLESNTLEDIAAAANALTRLKSVRLSTNKLSDGAIQKLCVVVSAGALSDLEILGIEGNELGDDAIETLAKVCANPGALSRLRELRMSDNRVSTAGFRALAGSIAQGGLPALQLLFDQSRAAISYSTRDRYFDHHFQHPELEAALFLRGVSDGSTASHSLVDLTNSLQMLEAMDKLACYLQMHEVTEPVRRLRHALDAMTARWLQQHGSLARFRCRAIVTSLAIFLRKSGEGKEAEELLRRALAECEDVEYDDFTVKSTLKTASLLANVLQVQGEMAEACQLYHRVLEKYTTIDGFDPAYPGAMDAMRSLITLLQKQEKHVEAAAMQDRLSEATAMDEAKQREHEETQLAIHQYLPYLGNGLAIRSHDNS